MQHLAQFRIDFIDTGNPMGFRAPQEAAWILGEATDGDQQGRLELLRGKEAYTAATALRRIRKVLLEQAGFRRCAGRGMVFAGVFVWARSTRAGAGFMEWLVEV